MRRLTIVWTSLLALAFGAAGLQGQVQSHWLPNAWPWDLLPRYVSEPPAAWNQQMAAPLWYEQQAGQAATKVATDTLNEVLSGDTNSSTKQGRADATTLGDMLAAQREVVQLAQAAKWAEAAESGRKLMDKPKETCGDYTWDFLASAVAWSLIQTGNYQAAAEVHRAAVAAIVDADLKQFHRRTAGAIGEVLKGGDKNAPQPKPEELKDAARLQGILRKGLAEEARQTMVSIEKVKTGKTVDIRLSNLLVAYKSLRTIQAVDPVVTQRLIGDFKAAADSLVTDSAAVVLKQAAAQHEKLQVLERTPMRASAVNQWNDEVRKLWASLAEVKRLCRIHSYLERLGLAGAADRDTPFKAAHELLYAPPQERRVEPAPGQVRPAVEEIQYREVYKLVGGRTSTGTDYQRRGKSLEEAETTQSAN